MATRRGTKDLLALTALGFAGYGLLLPVAPQWAAHGGAATAGAGAVNGVMLSFTVLTQLIVPRAIRGWGWGPAMVAGLTLLGLPSLGHMLSSDLPWTLSLSAVRGVGFGFLTVTGSAAVAELVPSEHRGRAVGAYGLAIAAPQLLLLPAAPWVAETFGFWVVFIAGSVPLLGLVIAVPLGRTLDDVAQHGDGGPSHAGPAVYLPLLRPVVLLLGVTVAGGALLTFVPQATSSARLTMVALAVLTATAALSRWRFGSLADRYGTQSFLPPLVLLTALGMASIAWAVRDPEDTAAVPLVLGMALVGVCYGGLQNLTLVTALQVVPPGRYGAASAAWNLGFDAGTGIGAVLLGLVAADASFTHGFLVLAGVSLLTAPAALQRRRRAARRSIPRRH